MTDVLDISALYAARRPFALFRLPCETQLRRADDECHFVVAPWPGCVAGAIDVAACAPGEETMQPWACSTPRGQYLDTTAALVDELRVAGGKCVRMRSICRTGRRPDIDAAVKALFARFPDVFCHCFYTPATGLWLGATPELLLDCRGGSVSTMALAGTRRASTPGPWDSKNVREQAYVTDFILDVLTRHGLKPATAPTRTLRYGAIEHICTPIRAELPAGFDTAALLDSLSPTPAVAGIPREAALARIAASEDTPRRCYAGWVAISTQQGIRAFVNLRCAHISDTGWCIYAGGGITADSIPEAEWLETEAKAAVLDEILMNNSVSYEPEQ